jgi:hypothetical protein
MSGVAFFRLQPLRLPKLTSNYDTPGWLTVGTMHSEFGLLSYRHMLQAFFTLIGIYARNMSALRHIPPQL